MARCSTCHRRLRGGQPCPVHGGSVADVAPVTADPFDWPTSVGPLLGAGGFAGVWTLDETRVIKVAHVSHELARARMAREAEALRAIGAGVPRCHDSGVLADGRAYIVIDRVAGATLGDVTADGPLRTTEAVALGLAILDALEGVHAARFVHRDIKPDNLVRTPDGRVVLLDFGLARKLPDDPDDPTRAHVQVGSLEYIAPEQIVDSATVDERSDIYAFGCVLFELVAGRPPFIGDAAALERAHTALRPPRLGALANVPAAIESLCNDCLAKEPAKRPATVAEVRERIAVSRDERTPPRISHSVSVIREGKQPVVLLWTELPRVDRTLLAMLTGRRVVIASQRGRRVLAGVLGGEHADPAAIAIAAARDLVAAGARVALHLDALRVGSAGGASTLHGESVDKPETWLPAGTWTGVVMTSALATVAQASTRAAEGLGPEFRAVGDDQASVELVGREGLLTDLVTDAATALYGIATPTDRSGARTPGGRPRRESTSGAAARTTGPAFALLVGDAGIGKTAFAIELARRLVDLGGIRVVHATVPAPGSGKPGHTALAELIGTSTGPIVRAVGDALRTAARERPTAVILDDLHYADHDLLDALEYATLGGEPLALWVLGVSAPRLETRRPNIGVRAERHRRDVLPPLDEEAAMALTASLLKPAEYPPLRALRRLSSMAHGNPLHLAMLVREVHQRGGVRARPGGSFFLDTAALDELTPSALGPWLAARELTGLGVELVALARVCAVLGEVFERAELNAIVESVERGGGATTTIDVDIGLAELVGARVLDATAHGHGFRQPLVQEGIYTTTNEDERDGLHRAALAFWLAQAPSATRAERVARHAEAIGDATHAASGHAELGQRALVEHRSLDADQEWTGALRYLTDVNAARAQALLGRARSRYRLQRVRDALVDLDEALVCARALDDPGLEIDVLLERSTVLDWAEDFAASIEAAERARERLPAAPSSQRDVGLALATGRHAFREGRFADAVPILRDAMAGARRDGLHDVQMIAGVILAPALVELRELDSAEVVFTEVIALCERSDDRLHLGAAYANRAWLWSARGQVERTASDLRQVIQLAREIGQSSLERIATYNLAEDLLWRGEYDEALALARRCLAIQDAHGEGSTRPDRMLLARLLAASADPDELAPVLETFVGEDLGDDERATLAVLQAAAAPGTSWQPAIDAISSLSVTQQLELMYVAARYQGLTDAQREQARQLAAADPFYAARISEL